MTLDPNRDKWTGWVSLAWLVAVVAIVGGVVMIAIMGTVEVPTRDVLGNVRWREEPNLLVWGAAIGQGLAGLLLAAIFSMLNSVYQNTWDLLHGRDAAGGPVAAMQNSVDEEDGGEGIKLDSADYGVPGLTVLSIHSASPLFGRIQPGYSLLAVNGRAVTAELEAAQQVRPGVNAFTFRDAARQQILIDVEMEPGPLHMRFS